MTIAGKSSSTKKASKSPSLKNVPETEGEVVDEVDDRAAQFGIRSYLNQFYDLGSPDEGDPWSATGSRRRAVLCWRAILVIGMCALVVGAIGIIVGYLWPHKLPHIEGEMPDGRLFIVDKENDYNEVLQIMRIVALSLFAVGGLTIAIALLVPTFCYIWSDRGPSYLYAESKSVSERRSSHEAEEATKSTKPTSPTEKKIPVMEDIQPVQPATKQQQRTVSESDLLLDDDK